MNDIATALISVGSTLIAGLTSGVAGLIATRRKQKKLERQLKELLNYTFGLIDMLLSDKVKIRPDLKKQLKSASLRYHSLDLIPSDKVEVK